MKGLRLRFCSHFFKSFRDLPVISKYLCLFFEKRQIYIESNCYLQPFRQNNLKRKKLSSLLVQVDNGSGFRSSNHICLFRGQAELIGEFNIFRLRTSVIKKRTITYILFLSFKNRKKFYLKNSSLSKKEK